MCLCFSGSDTSQRFPKEMGHALLLGPCSVSSRMNCTTNIFSPGSLTTPSPTHPITPVHFSSAQLIHFGRPDYRQGELLLLNFTPFSQTSSGLPQNKEGEHSHQAEPGLAWTLVSPSFQHQAPLPCSPGKAKGPASQDNQKSSPFGCLPLDQAADLGVRAHRCPQTLSPQGVP